MGKNVKVFVQLIVKKRKEIQLLSYKEMIYFNNTLRKNI